MVQLYAHCENRQPGERNQHQTPGQPLHQGVMPMTHKVDGEGNAGHNDQVDADGDGQKGLEADFSDRVGIFVVHCDESRDEELIDGKKPRGTTTTTTTACESS